MDPELVNEGCQPHPAIFPHGVSGPDFLSREMVGRGAPSCPANGRGWRPVLSLFPYRVTVGVRRIAPERHSSTATSEEGEPEPRRARTEWAAPEHAPRAACKEQTLSKCPFAPHPMALAEWREVIYRTFCEKKFLHGCQGMARGLLQGSLEALEAGPWASPRVRSFSLQEGAGQTSHCHSESCPEARRGRQAQTRQQTRIIVVLKRGDT